MMKAVTPNNPDKGELAFIESINDTAAQRGGWNFINEDGWTLEQKGSEAQPVFSITQGIKSPETSTLPGIAALNDWLDAIRLILEKGGDINVRDSEGETPLHKSAYWGRTVSAKLLIERGADIKAENRDGMTPLHLTTFFLRVDIAELLLNKGADVNARNTGGETPLFIVRNYILSNDDARKKMDDLLSSHGGTDENSIMVSDEKSGDEDTTATDARAFIKEGILKHEAGQFNEAIKLYTRALRISIGNSDVSAEVYYRSAESKAALKKDSEALTDIEMAIYLNKNDCRFYLLRGELNRKTGNTKEADNDIRKAKEMGCGK